MDTLRSRSATALTLVLSLFVLGTAVFGAREALVQRSIFLALVIGVALLRYPLLKGTRWWGLGGGSRCPDRHRRHAQLRLGELEG